MTPKNELINIFKDNYCLQLSEKCIINNLFHYRLLLTHITKTKIEIWSSEKQGGILQFMQVRKTKKFFFASKFRKEILMLGFMEKYKLGGVKNVQNLSFRCLKVTFERECHGQQSIDYVSYLSPSQKSCGDIITNICTYFRTLGCNIWALFLSRML